MRPFIPLSATLWGWRIASGNPGCPTVYDGCFFNRVKQDGLEKLDCQEQMDNQESGDLPDSLDLRARKDPLAHPDRTDKLENLESEDHPEIQDGKETRVSDRRL